MRKVDVLMQCKLHKPFFRMKNKSFLACANCGRLIRDRKPSNVKKNSYHACDSICHNILKAEHNSWLARFCKRIIGFKEYLWFNETYEVLRKTDTASTKPQDRYINIGHVSNFIFDENDEVVQVPEYALGRYILKLQEIEFLVEYGREIQLYNLNLKNYSKLVRETKLFNYSSEFQNFIKEYYAHNPFLKKQVTEF